MKIGILTAVLVCLGTGMFIGPAAGEETAIGRIKKVSGQVVIERAGKEIPARPGDDIFKKDVLKTGDDGSIGVILSDNSVMSMGEESRLSMTEYEFDPAVSRLSCIVNIFKGTMTYLTGIIGKINPEAVKFHTPTAIIGIRGTHLAINVEE